MECGYSLLKLKDVIDRGVDSKGVWMRVDVDMAVEVGCRQGFKGSFLNTTQPPQKLVNNLEDPVNNRNKIPIKFKRKKAFHCNTCRSANFDILSSMPRTKASLWWFGPFPGRNGLETSEIWGYS